MDKFDPLKDKIAVVVKSFTLKRKSEFFLDRFSEPYIVSMAIDEHGAFETSIDFNVLPFPNVRKGEIDNDFIKTKTSIIPLDVSNKMGAQTRAIKL